MSKQFIRIQWLQKLIVGNDFVLDNRETYRI